MATLPTPATDDVHHRRFLEEWAHLAPTFGADGFGQKAEAFARFFGTPTFLVGQTVLVAVWIVVNMTGLVHFDVYPFILLNLAFSLQAAYAAPLILLAQTRQADRDKAQADSDAQHREDVAKRMAKRQRDADHGIVLIQRLLDENTALTKQVQELTQAIHGRIVET